jgi:hypothetical protein
MRIYLSIFFLSISLVLFGQVQQPDRYEIELEPYEDPFHVLSAEEAGVMLYKATDDFESGNQKWQFIKLDTTLNEEWVREYGIDRDYIYKGYEYRNHSYFFLFQTINQRTHNLHMVQMNEFTGDTLMHTIKNLVHIELSIFEMSDNSILIGGYYNQEPVVMHYDLRSKKTKFLPGIFGDRTELVQVKIEQGFIKILVSSLTFDRRNTMAIKTYDYEGNYIDNFSFNPEGDIALINGRIAEIDNVGTIISGTYGVRRSEYSRGLFIAQHKAREEQVLRYFNFADLDNFFTYLKAKRQTRISNKISRKKVNGKKVKFNYRLIVHEIIESGDNYIMIGEAYYPKYNNNYSGNNNYGSNNNYSGNNNIGYANNGGNSNTPTSFAGYRYTHAVVIGFDKEGQKLWDNSFQIEDVLTYNLNQYVQADVIDDNVVLFYLYNNEIRTKIISGSEVIEGKSFDSVKMMFAGDVAINSSYSNIGGLEKWYGHNFLAYGMQKIKNLKDSGVKLNRRVFYINKIYYDEIEDKNESQELIE